MLNNYFYLTARPKEFQLRLSKIIRDLKFSHTHRWVSFLVILFMTWFASSGGAQAQQHQQTPNDSASDKSAVGQPPVNSTAAAADDDARYRIGPGDVLDIRVLNRPNLSREAVRVEGNGMIRMPLIEREIRAACLTEGELAREITSRYLKFYRNPQVDVFIKEYHSKQVAIIGAVNEQGRYELQRRVRLLELLSYAKGPSEKAGQTINVVHAPPALPCKKPETSNEDLGGISSYRLSETLAGNSHANPYLESGDIITLPEADQVYVVGNVNSPITIPLREPVTLSRAIAMAGGLRQDSKKDKVRIVRQEPGSQTKKEIIVDLSAIEKKRAEDLALLPNDIVDVPTSAGKSLMRSLLGRVAPTVSQLPIRVIP